MSELTKTGVFLGCAALSVLVAIASRPSTGDYDASVQIGGDIAAAFEPDKAKRLTITRYDEATAEKETFEVAESKGVWSLPSKGGYPADAQRQLAEAITGVTDREILRIASQEPSQHAEFGVVDPLSSKLVPGQTGVGQRVALAGADGEKLVDLIIGKEVKDADGQHYVRRAGQEVVYVLEIDPGSFSTNFADWIEDDLLKISTWDIQRVLIRNYSSELFITRDGRLGAENEYRGEIKLRYDDSDSAWSLEGLAVPKSPESDDYDYVELAEDEELNEDTLRELKNALDDLKIVDVTSKPESLSDSLKSGGGVADFFNDQSAAMSLITRGFGPTANATGEIDILSSEGEVVCTMKDGVEYVLRFGNLELNESQEAGGADSGASADGLGDEGAGDAEKGVNRYLFVQARLNESVIERPELEEVPALPEGATGEADGAGVDADQADAGDGVDGAAKGEDASQGEGVAEENADEEPAADDANEPTELEKAVAARKEVEQRNARMLEEYEGKLEQARERVRELNARFGDWYYVVANEVFTKVRLGREDVIKKKAATGEEEPAGDAAGGGGAASAFGAPGGAVPGLPGFGAALNQEAEAKEAEGREAEGQAAEESDGEAASDSEVPEQEPLGDQPPAAEPPEEQQPGGNGPPRDAEPKAEESPATPEAEIDGPAPDAADKEAAVQNADIPAAEPAADDA